MASDYLPVPNSTKSYWRSKPMQEIDELRTTEQLPERCDIAIIGTGMSGVSTAYHILNQHDKKKSLPPSIVLLEARQVCSGATGRNGGHIKIQTQTLLRCIRDLGFDKTAEIAFFIQELMHALKWVVDMNNLDCEAQVRRSYDVFLDAEEAAQVKKLFDEHLKEAAAWTWDIDYVPPEHAERVTGVKGAKAAFSVPAYSLWPYKFVTQLLAIVLARGANLQTNTPVTKVEKDANGRSLVVTSRGTLIANKVVFATNAYTTSVLSVYRNVIVPYKGMCSHISPGVVVPTAGFVPYLTNTYNIRFSPNCVDYLNPRPDGAIVVGGGAWHHRDDKSLWWDTVDDSTLIKPTTRHFEQLMQQTFNGWERSGADVDYLWTGIMGSTPDQFPHVGQVPTEKNWYILAGFNGGGMPLIFLSALGVARMICEGVSFEESGVPSAFKATKERLASKH